MQFFRPSMSKLHFPHPPRRRLCSFPPRSKPLDPRFVNMCSSLDNLQLSYTRNALISTIAGMGVVSFRQNQSQSRVSRGGKAQPQGKETKVRVNSHGRMPT
mmetsp:Transcript_21893/g.43711  ORF Transcript_21893/g.43711 Transcript_21893/m.43711 type:complete len:101 (-) Transcript_21893:443-745(-)